VKHSCQKAFFERLSTVCAESRLKRSPFVHCRIHSSEAPPEIARAGGELGDFRARGRESVTLTRKTMSNRLAMRVLDSAAAEESVSVIQPAFAESYK
jgi:hypothetical protein